ncbi:J domain-containing protein [Spirosoma foliorum]|uniref:J domain-containing protein n=1 Tax=Spirosoma foliorum TaxID=2710596 RepID=A0A7G5GVY0_9BACT|nr:J domain-containing protein [Spirosoma foliorum]QMW03022.1 J domain-containing protein [Spirosoma foliorum]
MNVQSSLPAPHPAKDDLLAQIRALEAQIALLEEEKAACQYQIDRYYRLFRLQLGDLLTQTVELQLTLSLRKAAQTGRRSDAETAKAWQDTFEKTNRAVREAVAHQPTDFDEIAEREIRRLYRQAVMLAHPDRHVNDPDRMAQATTYMARLNDAYQRRDLTTVRQLVQDLNDGLLFITRPETNLDLEALREWHQRLVGRQAGLQTEVNHLKATEAYQCIANDIDLIAHFANLREQMQQQLVHLQHQFQSS